MLKMTLYKYYGRPAMKDGIQDVCILDKYRYFAPTKGGSAIALRPGPRQSNERHSISYSMDIVFVNRKTGLSQPKLFFYFFY